MRLLTFLSIILMLGLENCNVKDELVKLFIDVSGNVSDDGQPVSGALVLLLSNPSISDGVNLENGGITGSDGNYTIIKVDAGDYYVVAIDDINGNLQYDAGEDRFGFYGVNLKELKLLPKQITVSDSDVENIDVTEFSTL